MRAAIAATAVWATMASEEPAFEPSMRGEIGLGNYRSVQTRATGTTPLTDTIALRLTMTDTVRDRGFQTIPRTGERVHDLHSFGVRGQLLFRPDSAFRLPLIGDYSDLSQDCCTGVITAIRTTRIDGSQLPVNFLIRTARAGYVPLPIDPYARRLETNRPFSVKVMTYGGTGIAYLDFGAATGWRKLRNLPATDGDVIGLGQSTAILGDPRTYGVTLKTRL